MMDEKTTIERGTLRVSGDFITWGLRTIAKAQGLDSALQVGAEISNGKLDAGRVRAICEGRARLAGMLEGKNDELTFELIALDDGRAP